MYDVDMERLQREEARWRILRVLDAARPMGAAENLIWRAVTDLNLPLSPRDIRRELDLLEDLGLAKIRNREDLTWTVELSGQGALVVEYSVPAPAGIARPQRI